MVERLKPLCKATLRPGCDAELGGFGALFDLSAAGYGQPHTDPGDEVHEPRSVI